MVEGGSLGHLGQSANLGEVSRCSEIVDNDTEAANKAFLLLARKSVKVLIFINLLLCSPLRIVQSEHEVLLYHVIAIVQGPLKSLVNFYVLKLLVCLLDKMHFNAIREAEVLDYSPLLAVGSLLTMNIEVSRRQKVLVVAAPILPLQLISLNSDDEELFEDAYALKALHTWRCLVNILTSHLLGLVE